MSKKWEASVTQLSKQAHTLSPMMYQALCFIHIAETERHCPL